MKKLVLFTALAGMVILTFGSSQATAGEVDLLIEKLVEKGILTRSDAKELRDEIKVESAKQQEAVKEVAKEIATEVATKESAVPKWVNKIKLGGDLRLRHDTQWREEKDGDVNYDRHRERFRLRVKMDAQVLDSLDVGLRFASGAGEQNTTNQSYDSHFRGKAVWIDRVYAAWKPNDAFSFVVGKQANPLFASALTWDPDVNPEGLSEKFNLKVSDGMTVFANFGQWVLEEIKTKDFDDDPKMYAFQLGTHLKPSDDMKLELAATYYYFSNLDRYSSGDLFTEANGSVGQQMVFDSEGYLLIEFNCFELGAKLQVKEVLPIPFSVFGYYVQNTDADTGKMIAAGSLDFGDDPADLTAYGGDDRDTGWQIGFDLGTKKKKADWYIKYFYQVLEDYAFPAVLVDSDYHGGGTNNQGHYLQGRYFLTDNIYTAATLYLTERENEAKDGQKDEDRIQLDFILKF